jgi:hypothetical protein
MTMVMESSTRIFRDIKLYSALKVKRSFRGTLGLRLEGRRKRQARNKREAGSKQMTDFQRMRAVIFQKTELVKQTAFRLTLTAHDATQHTKQLRADNN